MRACKLIVGVSGCALARAWRCCPSTRVVGNKQNLLATQIVLHTFLASLSVGSTGASGLLGRSNCSNCLTTRPRPNRGHCPNRAHSGQAMDDNNQLSFLTQEEATNIDVELMGPLGFSVDQLMELAGLSVACSIAEVYPARTHSRVLVLCGPGNNGGDGLVCARHLHHFGYKPVVLYPKPTSKPLYDGLVIQVKSLNIPFVELSQLPTSLMAEYDIVVDALFGFSFKGEPRPPFDHLLARLVPKASPPPIVSVDIPSGWDVELGDVKGTGMRPDMLVSLTAPKKCARMFGGPHHFLGGRFVPPAIAEKYKLRLPEYQGTSMCVRITSPPPLQWTEIAAPF
eukprot:jgi/Mesvir1/776/Mv17375-RA.1